MLQMPRLTLGAVLAVLMTASVQRVYADSWMPPRESETRSANGRFSARVVPRTPEHPAQLFVQKTDAATPKALWKADLSNADCPLEALVSDDGQHVVTFDNWYGAGDGDDVLAFYDPTGQRRKYSLEQLLAPLGIDPEAFPGRGRIAVPRSVSSRWWRQDNITVVDQQDGKTYLCIWLGWAGRWVAWDIATGEQVKEEPERIARWNQRAHEIALATIGQGGTTAMRLETMRAGRSLWPR